MQHTSHFVLAAWSQAQHLLQRWKEQVRKQQITWSWSLRISSLRFETSYPSYRWSHNGFLQLLYLKWHPKSNKQSDTTWEEAPASCRSRYRTSLEQSSGSVFGWYSSIWLWSCAVVFSICFIFLQSFLWFQAGPRLTSCYKLLQHVTTTFRTRLKMFEGHLFVSCYWWTLVPVTLIAGKDCTQPALLGLEIMFCCDKDMYILWTMG